MSCLVRNRNKLYKRVLLDVWGHHWIYRKISKAINFIRVMREEGKARYWYYKREFVYSFERRKTFRRKRRFKEMFIQPRYLKNFYLVLTRNNFRTFFFTAKNKAGYFVRNYLTFLEGRLFMIIYRSNFVSNIFAIKYLIKKGIFFVNNIKRKHSNYCLTPGDILHLEKQYIELIKVDILLRFENNIIFWKTPNYLYINYNFFFIMFFQRPKLKHLKFPIRIDVFIGSEYYMP